MATNDFFKNYFNSGFDDKITSTDTAPEKDESLFALPEIDSFTPSEPFKFDFEPLPTFESSLPDYLTFEPSLPDPPAFEPTPQVPPTFEPSQPDSPLLEGRVSKSGTLRASDGVLPAPAPAPEPAPAPAPSPAPAPEPAPAPAPSPAPAPAPAPEPASGARENLESGWIVASPTAPRNDGGFQVKSGNPALTQKVLAVIVALLLVLVVIFGYQYFSDRQTSSTVSNSQNAQSAEDQSKAEKDGNAPKITVEKKMPLYHSSGSGYAIILTQKETIAGLKFDTNATGGKFAIRATDISHAIAAPNLYEGEFGDNVTVNLPETVESNAIIIWYSVPPTINNDDKSVKISNIEVFAPSE